MIKTLSPYEERVIENVINTFSKISEIKGIILYGSRVRGDSIEDSDMDILVLYEGELTGPEELKRKALPDLEDYLYVSIVFYPLDDFASSEDPFVINIKKEGKWLWKRD